MPSQVKSFRKLREKYVYCAQTRAMISTFLRAFTPFCIQLCQNTGVHVFRASNCSHICLLATSSDTKLTIGNLAHFKQFSLKLIRLMCDLARKGTNVRKHAKFCETHHITRDLVQTQRTFSLGIAWSFMPS